MIAAIAVLAAAVVALRVSGLLSQHPPGHKPLSTPADSDYYITHAVVHQMNPDGSLAYRMKTARILHFPDGATRLKRIALHYLSDANGYWNITAARGRIPPKRGDIYLYAGVVGRHPMPGHGVVEVRTDHAWVYPDAKRLATGAQVTAHRPGQRISGRGMTVDLKTDTLRLRDDVRATYTP